jgi:hypothetical protein
MITSFEVGAVFRIVNEASPALRMILRQIRELNVAIDKALGRAGGAVVIIDTAVAAAGAGGKDHRWEARRCGGDPPRPRVTEAGPAKRNSSASLPCSASWPRSCVLGEVVRTPRRPAPKSKIQFNGFGELRT